MGSLISSLYTGASGIYSNQAGVEVTGNNIANINTEGYSRQTVSIKSSNSVEQGGLLFGSGSAIDSIDRADNIFITRQLIAASANYGEYEAASTPLNDIEQILDISETSLASDIDSFFDAWEALSSNPGGSSERQQVIIEGEDLANHFQQISQNLSNVVDSIDSSIESLIPELNDMLLQIAELNGKILQSETAGGDANTLHDQRDLLLQQVGEFSGATTYTDNDGMACLQLENGLPLVIGQIASTLSTEQVGGLSQLVLTTGNSTFSLNDSNFGGALGGLLSVRDNTIPELQDEVDQLAYEIVSTINNLHTTGLDQNGTAGSSFFDFVSSTDPAADIWQGAAASITVLFDDPALIAAGTSGLNGDNSLSLQIAALKDTAIVDGSTFTEEYARIAAKAGLLVSSNEDKLLSGLENLNNIQDDRDTLSGVSSDEEMLLLIQYQSGYEAAANYLSVVKEMLDTLLAM
jgi:flagellar hook-associated protein 1 FlgK